MMMSQFKHHKGQHTGIPRDQKLRIQEGIFYDVDFRDIPVSTLSNPIGLFGNVLRIQPVCSP